jgi:hypothetical protein
MGITMKLIEEALPENAKMTKSVISEEEARKTRQTETPCKSPRTASG